MSIRAWLRGATFTLMAALLMSIALLPTQISTAEAAPVQMANTRVSINVGCGGSATVSFNTGRTGIGVDIGDAFLNKTMRAELRLNVAGWMDESLGFVEKSITNGTMNFQFSFNSSKLRNSNVRGVFAKVEPLYFQMDMVPWDELETTTYNPCN